MSKATHNMVAKLWNLCKIPKMASSSTTQHEGWSPIVEGDDGVAALPILLRAIGAWLSPEVPAIMAQPLRVRGAPGPGPGPDQC